MKLSNTLFHSHAHVAYARLVVNNTALGGLHRSLALAVYLHLFMSNYCLLIIMSFIILVLFLYLINNPVLETLCFAGLQQDVKIVNR